MTSWVISCTRIPPPARLLSSCLHVYITAQGRLYLVLSSFFLLRLQTKATAKVLSATLWRNMEYPEKASSWSSLRNCWMGTCLQIGKQLEELLCPHLPQLAKPRPAFCRCAFQPGTLPHSSTAMVTRKHLAYMG